MQGFCLAALKSSSICARNNRTGCLFRRAIVSVMAACSVGDVGRAVDVDTFFDGLKETDVTLIKQSFFIVRAIHVESRTGICHINEFSFTSGDSVSGSVTWY